MGRVGRYTNPTINVDWWPDGLPLDTRVEPIVLPTPDRASTSGTLYLPAGGAERLVALMHPRVDFTHHYLVPGLLRAGFGVWTQRSRWVGNDLNLVHERVLIDIATAHAHLAEQGHQDIVLLGNSGGASLYVLYLQQALRRPEDRLADEPAGIPLDLDIHMPLPSGIVLLAPHPGQGDLLQACIDPSVVDEEDPVSADPALDPFDPVNGFEAPPTSSHYDADFLHRYRAAQRARVARIDTRARALIAEQREQRARAKRTGDLDAQRARLAPRIMTVYRTDADLRAMDLDLSASGRDYGSLFGRRPDITNYGPVGFARLTTPRAWLSTWSGIATRAALRLTAPEVSHPTLVVSYTCDNSVFPDDVRRIVDALGTDDVTTASVEADHYGYRPGTEDRAGADEALAAMTSWLRR